MRPQHSTPKVAEDVAGRIRRLIHSGALGPGDRLPAEREFAAELGIARVSVRASLRLLADAGYVTVRRGSRGGTFVSTLDDPYAQWLERMRTQAGDLDAILDVRVGVEGHSAFLAAHRRSLAELSTMRQTIDDMVRSETRTSFRSADSQFHAAVASAARSPRLEALVMQARGEFFVPTDKLIFREQIDASVIGHRAVLVALERRDAEEAREAMAEHIEVTRVHFHRVIRGSPLQQLKDSSDE
ncbi:MAG: hypothetical protein C0498_09080 [Anaerolinea sp.]|jgi:DNA-binding FadR family transcriptional regulator|nr:hypothetical protein [Anaerolinea sp.]